MTNATGSDGVIEKYGHRLTTLEAWRLNAPPKSRSHWKDGRSAKENARLWLSAAPRLPCGIADVLRSCGSISYVRSWSAEPETRVRFDAFGGEPANIDMLVKAEDENGTIVIGIEAKADETFGSTVGTTLSRAQDRLAQNPRSKGVKRIQRLATTFGLDLKGSEVLDLRYQLLTLTAATLAEAQRQSAETAIVIIQEFVSSLTTAKYRARNARDLDGFMHTVFGHTGSVRHGPVRGPFRIESVSQLYFGKTKIVV